MTTRERLFGYGSAFDDPLTVWIAAGIGAVLVLAPLLVLLFSSTGRLPADRRTKVLTTWRSWLVLAPAIVVPVLLGAAWVIGAAFVLAIACYREFARVTASSASTRSAPSSSSRSPRSTSRCSTTGTASSSRSGRSRR